MTLQGSRADYGPRARSRLSQARRRRAFCRPDSAFGRSQVPATEDFADSGRRFEHRGPSNGVGVSCLNSEVGDCEGVVWLGGRDSNPDTVVQRAASASRSVSVRSVLLRSSRPPLRFASLRFARLSRNLSLCVSAPAVPVSQCTKQQAHAIERFKLSLARCRARTLEPSPRRWAT